MAEGKASAIQKRTFKEKCSFIWSNVTVEPLLAGYIIASVLLAMAGQNLYLEKACRVNLSYGDDVCDALRRRETANYTTEEETVQQLVAGMIGWKSGIQSLIPGILVLFWGSWSDRHGRRKPCMLIPIFGELLTTFGMIICAYFKSISMEVAGLVESIPIGFSGGWIIMTMAVFSYIADVTTEEERTFRIGILNMCFTIGIPIGLAISGLLLKYMGFYAMFCICEILYLISFLYGVFLVKEPIRKVAPENECQVKQKNLFLDFFDRKHVVETFKVAFKKGSNKRRLRVIMLIIVMMVVVGPMYGEMSVMYLFTRYRFNWSEVEFSFFSTYSTITNAIGTLFSVTVFSQMLKIDDALIGVMSSISKILSSFVYAFAVTDWQLLFAPIAEILNGTSLIAMRSIASKLVSSNELAKLNSLFGVAESLMPLLYVPMYTTVYSFTMKTLPGAFFLFGAALMIPAVVMFSWMYRFHKQDAKRRSLEANNGETNSEIVDNGAATTRENDTDNKDIEMDEENRLLEKKNDRNFSTLRVEHGEHCKL